MRRESSACWWPRPRWKARGQPPKPATGTRSTCAESALHLKDVIVSDLAGHFSGLGTWDDRMRARSTCPVARFQEPDTPKILLLGMAEKGEWVSNENLQSKSARARRAVRQQVRSTRPEARSEYVNAGGAHPHKGGCANKGDRGSECVGGGWVEPQFSSALVVLSFDFQRHGVVRCHPCRPLAARRSRLTRKEVGLTLATHSEQSSPLPYIHPKHRGGALGYKCNRT